MSAQIFYNNGSSSSEIITHLVNASDGQGLHFNGTDGNITLPSPPPDLGTKFSFEFIVQADSIPASAYAYLTDFGNGGRFSVASINGSLAIYDNGAGFQHTFVGATFLDDLKVHHVVVTVDGTSAVAYDNGNQVGTVAINSPDIDSCTAAKIGSRHDSGSYFNGTIYRARFWNKTLSQTDVTSVYESASIDYADQWGSQTIVIPGDFTGNLDGWDASNTWNSQTNPSNNMVLAANATAQRCRTSTQLTLGKRYRCTYTATSTAGAPAFAYHNSGTEYALTATVGSSTITNGTANSFEFVMPTAISTKYFYILATTASDGVTLDDVSVVEVGAVADFDLAFANPTQSTIVQNRSGSGDGTAAGGVSQISPIEQLNSRAARIGTSAATPADGELVVSGKVGIGMVPARTLDMQAASNLALRFYVGATLKAGVEAVTVAGGMISTSAVNDLAIRSQSNMLFSTGGNIERLRIDSAGNVGLGVVPAATVADYTALEIGGLTNISAKTGAGVAGNPTVISNNAFIDTNNFNTGWKRLIEDECSQHLLVDGTHKFRVAGSAATSAAITWIDALTISSAGVVNIANLSASSDVQTDGSKNLITSSDKRLKNDLGEMTSGLDIVANLEPHYFSWKSDESNTRQLGFYAQDVYDFLPEAAPREQKQNLVTPAVEAVAATLYVEGDELPEGKAIGDEKTPAVEAVEAVYEPATNEDGSPDYNWGFNGRPIIAALVAAVKELKAKVTALENA